MKALNKFFIYTTLLFIYVGFVLPYLISAKNTELVILGFASIIVVCYIVIYNILKNYLGGTK